MEKLVMDPDAGIKDRGETVKILLKQIPRILNPSVNNFCKSRK